MTKRAKFKVGQVIWHINAKRYMTLERRIQRCRNFRCSGSCWKVEEWKNELCDTKFRPLTQREKGGKP